MQNNNKKIGILTFHRTYNVGANLQAYALQHYIQSNIDNCEIIDFYPNNHLLNKSWKRKLLSFVKKHFWLGSWALNARITKFNKFQKDFYVLSDDKFYGDFNFQNISKYRLLISGSDQILSTSLSGNSMSYYLPFDGVKKISYASSFGKDSLNDLEQWAILNFFPKYENLSFREFSGMEMVSKLIKLKEKNVVVDPVLLLDSNEWSKLIQTKKPKKYILVYAVENTSWLLKTINQIKENTKLPVIILSACKMIDFKYGKTIIKFGPQEFLSYVNGAEYVITNSYHGFVFSLIFGKKAYVCSHSERNARLESLSKAIGKENCLISFETNDFNYVDGATSYANLTNIIAKSKSYLLKNIGKTNDQ